MLWSTVHLNSWGCRFSPNCKILCDFILSQYKVCVVLLNMAVQLPTSTSFIRFRFSFLTGHANVHIFVDSRNSANRDAPEKLRESPHSFPFCFAPLARGMICVPKAVSGTDRLLLFYVDSCKAYNFTAFSDVTFSTSSVDTFFRVATRQAISSIP